MLHRGVGDPTRWAGLLAIVVACAGSVDGPATVNTVTDTVFLARAQDTVVVTDTVFITDTIAVTDTVTEKEIVLHNVTVDWNAKTFSLDGWDYANDEPLRNVSVWVSYKRSRGIIDDVGPWSTGSNGTITSDLGLTDQELSDAQHLTFCINPVGPGALPSPAERNLVGCVTVPKP